MRININRSELRLGYMGCRHIMAEGVPELVNGNDTYGLCTTVLLKQI